MGYFVKADKFLLENGEKTGGYLNVKDGKFGSFIEKSPVEAEIIDWSGYTVAPGLFDTHIHGVNGYDVMDGTVEAIQGISESILPLGVTRFLPTTLTSSKDELKLALNSVRTAMQYGLTGAQSEGIFMEGPYFTEEHKGAQNPEYFCDPKYKEFQEWQKTAGNSIVKVALAPEREGAIEFIRRVSNEEVLLSLAHTNASFERCKEAINAGAKNFVHLFNGMSGMHHREPGVAGSALIENETFAELICDGHHVHPEVAAFTVRTKKEKLVLITDCMRAGLMPDGNYHLGEFPVVMKEGIARTEAGSLAGSTLRLIDGVRNLYAWSGRPLYEVWHRASLSPAASLGRDKQLGSIAEGKIADFVAVDEDFVVHGVAINGDIKYLKD